MLRDVLGFHASEVAELLGTSVDSVTSALKRARASLERRHVSTGGASGRAGSAAERAVVARFAVGLYVLTLAGDRIGALSRFERTVLPWFGLPAQLPAR